MSGIETIRPSDIERRSFMIIEETLKAQSISVPLYYDAFGTPEKDEELLALHKSIIYRCIHTTADFDFASTLRFSNGSVDIIRKLVRNGVYIITDTNMALTGINKKRLKELGGEAFCFMADEKTASEAKERGVTRAYIAMEHAYRLHRENPGRPLLFAIGNAPTALISLCRLYSEFSFRPDLVIGVPVGFVNVVASKELLMGTDIPYIINEGNKGGSPVAAAVVNAVLYS
ncbi:MAG: precorrin-8X methylmutase [Lachnospiraceae bacterium]|nr:precorrin-8X methylmutase [Lachnospiraceae bacterium]